MGQSKKKRRRASERQEASTPSGGGLLSGKAGPIAVLLVGLAAIAWQGGFFDDVFDGDDARRRQTVADDPQNTPGGTASRGTTSPRRPQLLTDSGEVRLTGVRKWDDLDDSSSDGWESEALHERVKKQLDRLGRLLTNPAQATAEALAPLLAEDFHCGELRPTELSPVLQDAAIVVKRGSLRDTSLVDGNVSSSRGADGLARAIEQLCGPYRGAKNVRYEFKVVRVDQGEGGAETEQLFSISGETSDGILEQHATWTTEWVVAADNKPKLRSIRVSRYEQARTNKESPSLFVDCTESALGKTACYREQILRGTNHWLERIPFRTMLNQFGMPGIAVGDVNGDGLDDVYLCQDPGIPNRLFLQNRDGTAREVSAEWGVDWLEDARGVLLIDLDNDGDQDLVVAIRGNIVLAENESQARFRVQTVLSASEDLTSLCAFDYDSDGRLDLYVCAYQPNSLMQESAGDAIGASREEFVVHDANDAAPNNMFQNVTKAGEPWKFVDVTKQVGLNANNRRWSFSAAAEDYDNDGDLDLYVANDYGRDSLYRNDAGEDGQRTFVDVSESANIENSAAGMAISWADYDRDGWMDAYASNMWSSAGHRITSQQNFMPGTPDDVLGRFRQFAAGNTLMRNLGDGTFENRSTAESVAMGRWAWGNAFFDLNNDGWEDLVVANGYLSTEDTGDL